MLAQLTRTAVYGPVRTVVWQGSAGDRRPYADQVTFSAGIGQSTPSGEKHVLGLAEAVLAIGRDKICLLPVARNP